MSCHWSLVTCRSVYMNLYCNESGKSKKTVFTASVNGYSTTLHQNQIRKVFSRMNFGKEILIRSVILTRPYRNRFKPIKTKSNCRSRPKMVFEFVLMLIEFRSDCSFPYERLIFFRKSASILSNN